MRIEGCTAIVTGAASGLGHATATGWIATGGNVVLVDLATSDGAAVAAALGDRAAFAPADVTDPVAVQAAVDLACQQFGRLDVAVNCAGIGTAARVLGREGAHDLDKFRRTIEVNLIGTFNVLRLAAVAMAGNDEVDGERGVIVNTASIAAFEGQIGQAAYAASKGGIVGMTLPIARDLARNLIRVNTIAPGTFDTPIMNVIPDEAKQLLAAGIPNPSRLGDPAEFGLLVRQIVTNPYLNGETIRLDGALRMPPR